MISICLPIYNYDCTTFVKELYKQSQNIDQEIQIIVIDDCSEPTFQEKLKSIEGLCDLSYNTNNLGRSQIRNKLAMKAKQEYLLFIDGDSQMISDTFLHDYIEVLKKRPVEVLCGGSIYPKYNKDKKFNLRWKYSSCREEKGKNTQSHRPYRSFTTNNFLVKKRLFEEIKFDERLSQYGHEDTLFGYRLKQNKTKIDYINNPVLNVNLDTNKEFLAKTTLGLENLLRIKKFLNNDEGFIHLVPILNLHAKLKGWNLDRLFLGLYNVVGKVMENRFQNGRVSLFWFDCYRMAKLIELDIQKN